MRRFLLTALVAAFALAGLSACGDDDGDGGSTEAAPTVQDPTTTGAELADEFFTILQEGDLDALDDFLSDAFQLQRADGSASDKDDYLANPAAVESFEIVDVIGTHEGAVLVARYGVVTEEVIDGETYSTDPAPRISTFVWSDDRWRLAGHANFNIPEG